MKASSPTHIKIVLLLCFLSIDIAWSLRLINSQSDKHHPAIYTVLSGRKELLMMQEPFWVQMVANGAVKEVHLWDYTTYGGMTATNGASNEENKAYLEHLKTKYKFVRVFDAPNQDRKNLDPQGFRDYYRYYKDNPYPGVIIKADDDIVYVNTSMVQSYVNYLERHQDIFMLSASVVNNGLCAYYQQKHGAIDLAYEKFENPQAADATGDAMGNLHNNATQAFRLQKWFQEHPTDFYVPGDVVYPIDFSINVNFVAFRGDAFSEIYELLMDQVPKERKDYYDEGAMTWDAIRKRGKKEAIYMGLVVAHMGFGAQSERFNQLQELWQNFYHTPKGKLFSQTHR